MTAQASYRPGMRHPGMAVRLLLAIALLTVTSIAMAADPAGRVISTTGTVTAVNADNESRAISRNDVVFPGETIRTAPRARAQIRFVDDALVALRPRTHFEIEAYAETDDDSGNAVMNLVQGALRALSGRIGNRGGDEYRMNTPTATVGIRGTDYSLQYCDADCAGDGRREGTYGRVNEGAVEVSNAFGSLELDGGSYFFIPADGPPEILLTPPDGVLDDVDDADGDGEPIDDVAAAPSTDTGPVSLLDRDPTGAVATGAEEFRSGEETGEDSLIETEAEPEPELAAFEGLAASAHVGQTEGGTSTRPEAWTYAAPDEAGIDTDEEGRLVRTAPEFFANFDLLDAQGMESAEIGATDINGMQVRWGRWEGSFRVDGATFDGGVVWGLVALDELTTPTQLGELAGLFEFGNPSGPLAVGDDASLWSYEDFTMGFDFANASVQLDRLSLAEVDGERVFVFSDTQSQDLSDGRFAIIVENSAGDALLLTGGFFGEQADGALTSVRVSAEDIEIVGMQILENLTDPDDAGIQEFELEGVLAYGLLGEFTEPNGTNEISERDVIGVGSGSAMAFIDSAGQLIRVVEQPIEGDDLTTEFDGMTHVDAGSLDALEARWGRWTEGVVTRTFGDDDPIQIDADYMYAYSQLDPTTPDQLSELNASFAYEHAGGPMAVSDVGNAWSVEALEIVFDFNDFFADVTQFDLARSDGGAFVDLTGSASALDLANWEIQVFGDWFQNEDFAGSADGQIDGRFIGMDADGALYTFEINLNDGEFIGTPAEIESILGTGVLEQGGLDVTPQ